MQYLQTVLAVLSFFASQRDTLKGLILAVQDALPDATGADKAAAVRGMLAKMLGIEAQIEGVWPIVAPVFNLIVGLVKGKIAGKATAPAG